MDHPLAVQSYPDPVLLVDRLWRTNWSPETGVEGCVAELLAKRADSHGVSGRGSLALSSQLDRDTELGRALHQDLRRTGTLPTLLHRSCFDNEARLLVQAARFEAGQVHLPSDASRLAGYIAELMAFPNGRCDDQVDSTSQALDYLTARALPLPPLQRRSPVRREIERR